MNKSVIIVAGGSGKRMQSEVPKQFLLLANKPLLMHTIHAFISYDTTIEIILVLPESQFDYWKSLCKEYHFNVPHTLCSSGTERFYSVKNGLASIKHNGLVAIHDGVRPLVSQKTIHICFALAEEKGNATPSLSLTDSVRELTPKGSMAVERDRLRNIQTPQIFKVDELKQAYLQDYHPSFTDDASVLEKAGLIDVIGQENFFETVREAVDCAQDYCKREKCADSRVF